MIWEGVAFAAGFIGVIAIEQLVTARRERRQMADYVRDCLAIYLTTSKYPDVKGVVQTVHEALERWR